MVTKADNSLGAEQPGANERQVLHGGGDGGWLASSSSRHGRRCRRVVDDFATCNSAATRTNQAGDCTGARTRYATVAHTVARTKNTSWYSPFHIHTLCNTLSHPLQHPFSPMQRRVWLVIWMVYTHLTRPISPDQFHWFFFSFSHLLFVFTSLKFRTPYTL